MCRNERVHERLEVRTPPLRERISNLPLVVDAFTRELGAHRRQSLAQTRLETLNLVIFWFEIVSRSKENRRA